MSESPLFVGLLLGVALVSLAGLPAAAGAVFGLLPQMASRCAPPARPQRWPMILTGLAALVCGLIFVAEVAPGLGLSPETHQSYGLAFITAATVSILLVVSYVERLDDWRVAHQEWLDQWVCMACGAMEARP